MNDYRRQRDMADDEELSILFTAAGNDLVRAIEDCIELAGRRSAFERRLIELLELAVDEGLDDPAGAVWIALILGEIQSRPAIPALIRALTGSDEALAEAGVDAIMRIGEPAFEAIMQALDGAEEPEFEHAAYQALAGAAAWEHPYLLEEVRDFLLERLKRPALGARSLEDAGLALARLGDRRALPVLKRILKERFKGLNPALQDAIEMLQENAAGVPIATVVTQCMERERWLTRDTF